MTAGKAMAQAAHAAQLGWRSLGRRDRRRWREAGFPLAVRDATARQWAAAVGSGAPVVHDGGFTEVEPGTATAVFTSLRAASAAADTCTDSYSSTVRWAMASQPNSRTARSRPARPIAVARTGSAHRLLTASASPASNSSVDTA